MKRLFDITVATLGFIFFLPFGILFALAVKLEDRGPIFYIQERWGKGGRKFKAYKFRSMTPDSEGRVGFAPAGERDPRVTRTGYLLRATAMDELPQLINIWKGDMSFVGPRALAVGEVDPSVPRFNERHRIRPGLTGPAQIFAPRDASLVEKFRYDLAYAMHGTFWDDVKLLFLSLWITLRGKWESRHKKF